MVLAATPFGPAIANILALNSIITIPLAKFDANSETPLLKSLI